MSLILPEVLLLPVSSGRDLSWTEIEKEFSKSAALEMGQSWLAEKDEDFRPGLVRAGICGEMLAVYAELIDDDIYNASQSLNEKTWTLGDVFEVFLKSDALPDYHEFHVTPENQKLQLHFPNVEAFRAMLPWGTHCLEGELFYSKTEVSVGRWKVYAEIPLRLFSGAPWRFSFCRYDSTRGKEKPVLSSTSPYSARNFHCPEEWGVMEKAEC